MKTEATEFSVEQLEAMLAEKKKAETEKEKKKRLEYEKFRNDAVISMASSAKELSLQIQDFHKDTKTIMESFKNKLEEYGKIRGNSKGGFQLLSDDKKYKVVYAFNSKSGYDERADKAEELLKDFMNDVIRKKDKTMHGIIMSLLERNGKGQLEHSRVQDLYKYENDYDDPRWKEAIRLFKESFMIKGSKMSIYFYELNEMGGYDLVPLNFSSL